MLYGNKTQVVGDTHFFDLHSVGEEGQIVVIYVEDHFAVPVTGLRPVDGKPVFGERLRLPRLPFVQVSPHGRPLLLSDSLADTVDEHSEGKLTVGFPFVIAVARLPDDETHLAGEAPIGSHLGVELKGKKGGGGLDLALNQIDQEL